jgi:transglutaminase-like putative cysteine protease
MGAVALPGARPRAPRLLDRPERARFVAFVPLALFGALRWGALLDPSHGGDMVLMLAVALAGAVALLSVPQGAPTWRRWGTAAAVAGALLALALLTAGVPPRLLDVRRWGELIDAIVQGIGSTAGVTVPYRGADDWVRITMLAGGTGLVGLSALLAFWPRREGTPGHHLAAAVALGALYAIPIIEDGPDHPYLSGIAFCALLATFLWLERMRPEHLGLGALVVLLAALAGALIAPRLNGSRPWVNYEALAEHLEPTKAEVFTWDHSYGPLHWSRDGRELLRIKAPVPAYWKAANLDRFDGVRWVEGQEPGTRAAIQRAQPQPNPKWFETIRVVDRGLRSSQFVGAGNVINILPGSSRAALWQPDGTWVTANKVLRPGDSYQAKIYVPQPNDTQLRRAGTRYDPALAAFRELEVPLQGASADLQDPVTGGTLAPDATVRFPAFGARQRAEVISPSGFGTLPVGDKVLRDSPYAQLYAVARALQRSAATPYQFALLVRDRVQQGTVYDETPPVRRYPLASFLFVDKRGYCQQFSGVMALMLRMGGVPARVVSGFSPGTYNSDRKDYVIRDTDAHSWVEAYFPGYGWYTFDPTPAASPAASQLDDQGSGKFGGPVSGPNVKPGLGGQRPVGGPEGSAGNVALAHHGSDWKLPVLGGVLGVLALACIVLLWRRRLPFTPLAPELAELQRALYRSGRHPPPDVTLARLEVTLGATDAAAAYVRAVRDRRFSEDAAGPTPAQRRALRRQLSAGLGLRGALLGWWALPPRPPKLGGLRRLRRSYTAS